MPLVFPCGVRALYLLFLAQFGSPFQVRRRPADSDKPTSKLDDDSFYHDGLISEMGSPADVVTAAVHSAVVSSVWYTVSVPAEITVRFRRA